MGRDSVSQNVPIDLAGSHLGGLVRALGPQDEIVLTENDKPIARIVPSLTTTPRIAGSCQGILTILQEDSEHLEDFKEFMP
jgi:antitoxin (DNA-binding transcriptional repressor) of toxin-antitoxin stability system